MGIDARLAVRGRMPVEFEPDASVLFVPGISEHVWIAEQAFA
jgi:hypothetical protein